MTWGPSRGRFLWHSADDSIRIQSSISPLSSVPFLRPFYNSNLSAALLHLCSSVHLLQFTFHLSSPLHFLCPLRVWPMPRRQSTWSGTAPTPWLRPPPPRSGSNSVASCSVASPSCCGSAPSSASWPTPSRLPRKTSPSGITWVDGWRRWAWGDMTRVLFCVTMVI